MVLRQRKPAARSFGTGQPRAAAARSTKDPSGTRRSVRGLCSDHEAQYRILFLIPFPVRPGTTVRTSDALEMA